MGVEANASSFIKRKEINMLMLFLLSNTISIKFLGLNMVLVLAEGMFTFALTARGSGHH